MGHIYGVFNDCDTSSGNTFLNEEMTLDKSIGKFVEG